MDRVQLLKTDLVNNKVAVVAAIEPDLFWQESPSMKTQTKHRKEKAHEVALQTLVENAEASFDKTLVAQRAETFQAVGQRCSEISAALREMRDHLSIVKDRHVLPDRLRELKRRLKNFSEFNERMSDVLIEKNLDHLLLCLETEFATIKPTCSFLEDLVRYPNARPGGK